MYHMFFICPSVSGHFHVLATVISASVDIGVGIFFQVMVFPRYVPRSGIAASYENSIFSFVRNFQYSSPKPLYQFTFSGNIF